MLQILFNYFYKYKDTINDCYAFTCSSYKFSKSTLHLAEWVSGEGTCEKSYQHSIAPIAIAGIAIESSTFSPAMTHEEAFMA